MSDSCRTCGKLFILSGDADRHVCPPEFEVWEDRTDRKWGRRIHAADPEEAAEQWAEDDDCGGDYGIVDGRSTPIVCVARIGEIAFERFEVEGEAVPRYRARRLR